MAYTPTAWVDDSPPPISAANLNKIEAALQAVVAQVDAIVAAGSNLRIERGTATTDNTINSGSVTNVEGWSATFSQPFSGIPTVVASCNDSRFITSISTPTTTGVSGFVRALGTGSATDTEDVFWIAVGPA